MAQWEGINEFVAVAETESFTAAGQRLGISTAQVSRQVSALEARLGSQLLYRTTRRVSLTESGRQFYQLCRPLLDGLEEAQRLLSEQQTEPSGRVRMTAPVNFGEQILAPLMAEFCAQYPKVSVEMMLSNQRLDLVQEGLDLAIRIGDLPDSSLKARRLGERALAVCAAPEYLARYGTPGGVEELSQHRCLVGTSDLWRFNVEGRPTSMKISGAFRCNSGVALLEAATRGLGLTQLPEHYLLEAFEQGRLVPVLEAYQPEPEPIWACYPPNRHVTATVRAFIDALSQALSSPS
ncbi:LysR family transcriptional regulator [Ferrimonas balearica]|uniref:LysR family transcriptional regulator n=1 Tax=Ferrimonas balearica TaxID=44012 RepID=UPI001C99D128|nr:LysR family transcriptional regulator [Ferrimonas balearica]MBY5920245.1 LysR family transcriptional regulator [Ferrimonas balearica]MBY5997070.1 LysR family transcriptional regulator [Ferrimonas balearica]